MLSEGEVGLTVRAVASRAGVGVGTLRHHFPTQRTLLDSVLAHVYEAAMPDDRIHDSSIPPRERLLENLRRLLAPVGTGVEARQFWGDLYETFISPSVTDETRASYPLLSAQATQRVEAWLAVLVGEGALATGDNTARARFLLTVVNGLAVERALPADLSTLELEEAALAMALDALPFRSAHEVTA